MEINRYDRVAKKWRAEIPLRKRLLESILKCYECQETSQSEEVEIVTREGKKYLVCPHCEMEWPIVDNKH